MQRQQLIGAGIIESNHHTGMARGDAVAGTQIDSNDSGSQSRTSRRSFGRLTTSISRVSDTSTKHDPGRLLMNQSSERVRQ